MMGAMQQVNPGLAKGYALDFAAPLRYVAESLDGRARSLDDLVEGYEHDAGDLDRVWDHELRQRGQRRSAKPEVEQERRAAAKRWLVQAALDALGSQVREEGDGLILAVPLDEAQVQGIPVAFDPSRVAARPKVQREPRVSSKRARESRAVPSGPVGEPEPPAVTPSPPAEPGEPEEAEPPASPPNPFREWVDEHGYTRRALARALGVKLSEVEEYVEGRQAAPRVVLLALWAIERGAEV